jgi:hypothetical protein
MESFIGENLLKGDLNKKTESALHFATPKSNNTRLNQEFQQHTNFTVVQITTSFNSK